MSVSINLISEVEGDIRDFLNQQTELLFNEFDFQMQLAIYLRMTQKYDDVESEYFMPTKNTDILRGYDWDSNMRIDIVVRRGEEYVPIELKYVTKKVVRDYIRFGELVKGMEILKNQAAQDIRRYDFWKDVRRIELIKNIFPKVGNGLAVFLTNDPSYLKDPKADSVCAAFSMSGNRATGGAKMDWQGSPAAARNHKPFRLEGFYRPVWNTTRIDDVEFNYTILKI